MARESQRLLGTAVTILSLVSLSTLLYSTYHERKIVECQSQVNAAFLATLKDRGKLFEEDRDSVNDLAAGLLDGDRSNDQKTLEDFYDRQERLDHLLQGFQYPDFESSCDGK